MTNEEKTDLLRRVERPEEEIAETKAKLSDIDEAKRSLFPRFDDI